jgi:hypothetical protein
MKILTPKTENLQTGPETQNGDFHENGSKDFHSISEIYGGPRP